MDQSFYRSDLEFAVSDILVQIIVKEGYMPLEVLPSSIMAGISCL